MENSDNQRDQMAQQQESNEIDEKELETQHQFQMFPTPDEKRASKVITELKD